MQTYSPPPPKENGYVSASPSTPCSRLSRLLSMANTTSRRSGSSSHICPHPSRGSPAPSHLPCTSLGYLFAPVSAYRWGRLESQRQVNSSPPLLRRRRVLMLDEHLRQVNVICYVLTRIGDFFKPYRKVVAFC